MIGLSVPNPLFRTPSCNQVNFVLLFATHYRPIRPHTFSAFTIKFSSRAGEWWTVVNWRTEMGRARVNVKKEKNRKVEWPETLSNKIFLSLFSAPSIFFFLGWRSEGLLPSCPRDICRDGALYLRPEWPTPGLQAILLDVILTHLLFLRSRSHTLVFLKSNCSNTPQCFYFQNLHCPPTSTM